MQYIFIGVCVLEHFDFACHRSLGGPSGDFFACCGEFQRVERQVSCHLVGRSRVGASIGGRAGLPRELLFVPEHRSRVVSAVFAFDAMLPHESRKPPHVVPAARAFQVAQRDWFALVSELDATLRLHLLACGQEFFGHCYPAHFELAHLLALVGYVFRANN